MKEKEWPKDRIDLILMHCIEEDIEKIQNIMWKYRGLDKNDELIKCLRDVYRLMNEANIFKPY